MTEGVAKGAQDAETKRVLTLVGLGYLFLILCDPRDGLAKLSTQFLLKDHMHLGAAQIAGFTALISFPWFLKPLAGLLTDNFPFLGTRRRGYLLASTFVGGALWISVWMIPKEYNAMAACLLMLNVALVMGQTTLGGLLVEYGREFKATGRMSSIRNGAENLGMLTAGLVGGFIAAHFLGPGFAFVGVLLWVLTGIFFRLQKEPRNAERNTGQFKATVAQFKVLFTSKTLWIASGFWMLVRFAPGFQTPLFFYQTETLKLSPEFLGFLVFINAGTALLGSLTYLYLCKRYPLRRLLYLGVTLSVISAFCYLGYKSQTSAMVVESAAGLGTGMAFLAILDLLARATPKGCEALGYALIFSFGNISVSTSDVFGSWLFDTFHQNFTNMVWVNSGTSAIVLLAIPFLPKSLTDSPDGHAPGETPAVYADGTV